MFPSLLKLFHRHYTIFTRLKKVKKGLLYISQILSKQPKKKSTTTVPHEYFRFFEKNRKYPKVHIIWYYRVLCVVLWSTFVWYFYIAFSGILCGIFVQLYDTPGYFCMVLPGTSVWYSRVFMYGTPGYFCMVLPGISVWYSRVLLCICTVLVVIC